MKKLSVIALLNKRGSRLLTFINNCSFDNKTGIWKEENKISKITLKKNDNLKPVFEKNQTIEKEVVNSGNIDITISKPLKNQGKHR